MLFACLLFFYLANAVATQIDSFVGTLSETASVVAFLHNYNLAYESTFSIFIVYVA